MSQKFKLLIEVEDDGMTIPEVRGWSINKYRLLGTYCDIFTTSMRNRWDNLVYIDLYAGTGYAKVKDTNKIYKSSSLIALSLPHKFNKYIFCDEDERNLNSLKERVIREFPEADVEFIHGCCNENVDKIKSAIPRFSKQNTVLSFCFVDPFSLNLKFSTIKSLGSNLMDFLILLALHMDANRNITSYIKEENKKIEEFLDKPDWRSEFDETQMTIVEFLANQYKKNMVELGYTEPPKMQHVRSNEKNLPLYYLAFYSKHPRGNEFWNKIKRYYDNQLEIPF